MKLEYFEGSSGKWGWHILDDDDSHLAQSMREYETVDDCILDVEKMRLAMGLDDADVFCQPLQPAQDGEEVPQ